MVIGLVINEIDWGVDTVVVLVMAVVFGSLIFAALLRRGRRRCSSS